MHRSDLQTMYTRYQRKQYNFISFSLLFISIFVVCHKNDLSPTPPTHTRSRSHLTSMLKSQMLNVPTQTPVNFSRICLSST